MNFNKEQPFKPTTFGPLLDIVDHGTMDNSKHNTEAKSQTFPNFLKLPPKLRLHIFRQALLYISYEVWTLFVNDSMHWAGSPLTVKTRQNIPGPHGLWDVNGEAREEAEKYLMWLPTRSVFHMGLFTADIPPRRSQHTRLFPPPVHRAFLKNTAFFMGQLTVLEVFSQIRVGSLARHELNWLRSILLDARTFERLLSGYHGTSGRQHGRPGAPFTGLSGLRKILVGFTSRLRDVEIAEGLLNKVISELQVTPIPGNPGGQSYSPSSSYLDLGLSHFEIRDALCRTVKEVKMLQAMGVEVSWYFIKTCTPLSPYRPRPRQPSRKLSRPSRFTQVYSISPWLQSIGIMDPWV